MFCVGCLPSGAGTLDAPRRADGLVFVGLFLAPGAETISFHIGTPIGTPRAALSHPLFPRGMLSRHVGIVRQDAHAALVSVLLVKLRCVRFLRSRTLIAGLVMPFNLIIDLCLTVSVGIRSRNGKQMPFESP